MNVGRAIAGVALTAMIVGGGIVAPAVSARDAIRISRPGAPVSIGSIGSFTPASADPKLAAVLARSGVNASSFRFTPADANAERSRSVTVAVRARTNRTAQQPTPALQAAATEPATVSLAPIAYNLGVSVGWKRFAVSGDVAKLDLPTQPGSQERVDLGMTYTGKRAAASVKAGAVRPLEKAPALIAESPSYSIDVGGSYSLTRHIDLTAGVRYKAERDRLTQLQDSRRDSQAVYIGTAFRF